VHGKNPPSGGIQPSVYLKVAIKIITQYNFRMILCPPEQALKNKKGQAMLIKALFWPS